jgi:hypothetical protein
MCRKRAKAKQQRTARGQVATEYALGVLSMAALGSMLFYFYQGFVQGNLYGTAGDNNKVYGLAKDYKAYGLERAVSLPFP